jgi:protein-L-isoaspartate(D-aspartate) O-methyltransferase
MTASDTDCYTRQREDLLIQIEVEAAATASFTHRPRFSPEVMAALARVPRHRFVPPGLEDAAYLNSPLAIGFGQTISQPFIVALMTELLELRPGAVVLEIGGGSGYQAAVLAELGARVYSIEFVEELATAARRRLHDLGYAHVEVMTGDGYYGWLEHAPYDAIIVTAATPEVPPPLLEQLKPGGRMVLPLGQPYADQDLKLLLKRQDGGIHSDSILPVAFVPFLHAGPPADAFR